MNEGTILTGRFHAVRTVRGEAELRCLQDLHGCVLRDQVDRLAKLTSSVVRGTFAHLPPFCNPEMKRSAFVSRCQLRLFVLPARLPIPRGVRPG